MNAAVSHVLASAKAYAALIGSVLTALIAAGVFPVVPTWLAVATAALTAVATYSVPNTAPAAPEQASNGDLGTVA